MRAFRDAPVRSKLTVVTMAITGLALMVAVTMLLVQERSAARAALLEKVDTTARIVGDNTSAALAFGEAASARQTLETLRADAEILGAAVIDREGTVFAAYGKAVPASFAPQDGARFQEDTLEVLRGIVVDGERIGSIFVRASLEKTYERLWGLAAFCLLVLVGVSVAAWALSSVLLRTISAPISHLARVVASVAHDRDYTVRAVKTSEDELGQLIDGFNNMLQQIQARDADLARAHESLEARVEDRTRALTQANLDLADEMQRRSAMELELRQAQKLESVGRLAAGVAHEINTPVQFVNDSCHFLKDALADLSTLVAETRNTLSAVEAGTMDVAAAAARIRELERAADVEYLLENMPGAVDRSLEGLQRVATIVRSMKEFAHPDQKEKAHADLNRAIESTLTIARNEYKYVAEVVTDFGELPPVCCFLSDLNQAVLNIVVNAAHAIGDQVHGTDRKGLITVRTRRDGEHVLISIQDTGGGIPDAIRDKIFDPFFTTKEVGKGTGQGLAIVRSVIVDKHQGAIELDTVPGQGSTFTLKVPINAAKAGEQVRAA